MRSANMRVLAAAVGHRGPVRLDRSEIAVVFTSRWGGPTARGRAARMPLVDLRSGLLAMGRQGVDDGSERMDLCLASPRPTS